MVSWQTIETESGGKIVLGFDFGESVFMHAIMHAHDQFGLNEGTNLPNNSDGNMRKLFQNFQVHIGDSASYASNAQCAGGPFLDPSKQSTFVYSAKAYNNNYTVFHGQRGLVWPFGGEIWCNMEGRYLHFVADLSRYMPNGSQDTVSICAIGVFGTKYVRDGEPVPTSITMLRGASETFVVANIYPLHELGNELAINLRQASSLGFVTLDQSDASSQTVVNIDSTGVDAGEYTLTLESFDLLSSVKSALKTDTVSISIQDPPRFTQELQTVNVTAGTGLTWALP